MAGIHPESQSHNIKIQIINCLLVVLSRKFPFKCSFDEYVWHGSFTNMMHTSDNLNRHYTSQSEQCRQHAPLLRRVSRISRVVSLNFAYLSFSTSGETKTFHGMPFWIHGDSWSVQSKRQGRVRGVELWIILHAFSHTTRTRIITHTNVAGTVLNSLSKSARAHLVYRD